MAFNRERNKMISKETLDILKRGNFTSRFGNQTIKESLETSVKGAILYNPEATEAFEITTDNSYETVIEVANETTVSAARRMNDEGFKVVALNFASARKPGGGFLTGAMAQEESIAYSSGLYPTISQMREMYDYHENNRSGLYSDYMIYSPNVPVFRDDKYTLTKPFLCSFITSPAVNAGIVLAKEPKNVKKIVPTMRTRIEKILKLALIQGNEAIILGAFGCGVFQNNPKEVAEIFADFLNGDFKGQFQKVVFAVLDTTANEEIINPFKSAFNQ